MSWQTRARSGDFGVPQKGLGEMVAARRHMSATAASSAALSDSAAATAMEADCLVKDSLMYQLPPEPPSPYRPQPQKRAKSVLPSFFQSKLESSKLRDKKLRQIREAAAVAEAEFQKTQIPVKRTLGKSSRPMSPESQSLVVAKPKPVKDTSAYDESIREYHFFEAQRQQVCGEEASHRTEMTTDEELACTRIMLAHFESLAHAIACSELTQDEQERAEEVMSTETEALRAEKDARSAALRSLLDSIASSTRARLTEERLAKELHKAFAALLPQHEHGRLRILAEEQEALLHVFAWEKAHRPLGPGCFISGPVEDPRLRYYKKVKRGRFHKPTTTERTIEELRKKKSASSDGQAPDAAHHAGALVVYMSSGEDSFVDPPNTTPESAFVEDGKVRYAKEKSARHEAIRAAMAMQDLFDAEEGNRADIQLAESEAYLPLLLQGVDGLYEARRASRERERREAVAQTEAQLLAIARLDAKARVLADDFCANPKAAMAFVQCAQTECGSVEAARVEEPASAQEEEETDKESAEADDGADLGASPLENALDPTFHGETSHPLPLPQTNLGDARTNSAVNAVDMTSMIANPGDLPSMVSAQTPLGSFVRSSFTTQLPSLPDLADDSAELTEDERAQMTWSIIAEAFSAATKYLCDELWTTDLMLPVATAAMLTTVDNDSDAAREEASLLMDYASARTDVVNEQIEAVLDLCFPDLS